MAGGFTRDGAVQEQIDASLKDEIERARSKLPQGESAFECEQCGNKIPEARRKAMSGVKLCVRCQEEMDQEQTGFALYNRRGSKDSQLR